MQKKKKSISKSKKITVGELAKKAGVTPRTIRYYEEVGLLPPLERTSNGYRTYTDNYINGVKMIRRAKRLGFSLKELKELLKIRLQYPENEKQMILRSIESIKANLKSTYKKMKDMKDHISLLESEIKRLEVMLQDLPKN